ncbi:hypothetical protein MSAN_00441600 [Mycena sanguinolenta]|uniref:Uncharacterized protein n=1 Tax=Mycena sanguinolenta TaxID=230812 RepID=A0A8H7DHF2_9AGAR|nr:hypothetical protein MSAN_00441600 [Mycena sanguinolenta]
MGLLPETLPYPDPASWRLISLFYVFPSNDRPTSSFSINSSFSLSLCMASPSAQVPTAASPAQELGALVSQVQALSLLSVNTARRSVDVNDKEMSKLALDMNHCCVELWGMCFVYLLIWIHSEQIPRVVHDQVQAALAQERPFTPMCYEHVAPTPDEMEASLSTGGDTQAWYVVCVGRHPGFVFDC